MSSQLFHHDALGEAILSFNRWRRDAMPMLGEVLENEPELAMANIAKALILMGGRDVRFLGAVDDCIQKAAAQREALTAVEQKYLQALQFMRADQYVKAVSVLESIVSERPTDFFAHRLVQQELFWSGNAEKMRDIAATAYPHWSGDEADYGNFLGLLAFGHEETGNYGEAEALGREAVERDSSDAWGAHAVAHVLEMQGRTDDGIEWLEALTENWGEVNQIAHHVWWHLCLFYMEQGQHDRILELLASQVHNPDSPLVKAMPDLYIDVQNVASLLFRLSLRGVDVGSRWENYIEAAQSRIDNHMSPFTSAHAAIIFCAAERFDDCDRLIDSMRQFSEAGSGDLAGRIGTASLPAAEATRSWFRADYDGVVDRLLPAHAGLNVMGGSHAQRDIFSQMLFQACRKSGRDAEAEQILASRKKVGYSLAGEAAFWH